MAKMTPSLPANLDKDTVFRFFVAFSRFEYAMKKAGYLELKPDAKPDWGKLESSLKDKLHCPTAGNLKLAIEYPDTNPPKKQINSSGALGWEETKKDINEPLSVRMSKVVRTVRNNLFHGGKFPIGTIIDPTRDTKLLESCLEVMGEFLRLCPEVEEYFQDPFE